MALSDTSESRETSKDIRSVMLVTTPEKYQCLKNADIRRSYQHIIDAIIEFKRQHPEGTIQELNIYAIGIVRGRTKQVSHIRTK